MLRFYFDAWRRDRVFNNVEREFLICRDRVMKARRHHIYTRKQELLSASFWVGGILKIPNFILKSLNSSHLLKQSTFGDGIIHLLFLQKINNKKIHHNINEIIMNMNYKQFKCFQIHEKCHSGCFSNPLKVN